MKVNVWIQRLVIIAFGLWMGSWQEHIKIDINYLVEQGGRIPNFDNYDITTKLDLLSQSHAYMPFDYYFSHAPIELLVSLKLHQLAQLKWGVTCCAILIFFSINHLLIRTFDRPRLFFRPLWMGYLSVTSFSFLFFVLGRILGFPKEAYSVSREIIGGLQSMVPVMIIFPLHLFISKQSSNHDSTRKLT